MGERAGEEELWKGRSRETERERGKVGRGRTGEGGEVEGMKREVDGQNILGMNGSNPNHVVNWFIYLSIYLSICLSIYLSVHISFYLSMQIIPVGDVGHPPPARTVRKRRKLDYPSIFNQVIQSASCI